MNQERLGKVLGQMADSQLPQMVITDPAALFYLTGKWIHPGERMVALYLNLNGNHKLFLNNLFHVPEDLGVDKIWYDDTEDSIKIFAQYIDKAASIGIDKNWPSHFLLRLMGLKGDSAFVNGSQVIDRLRMCKDKSEQQLMREASQLNDEAMCRLIGLIPQRYSEKRLKQLLSGIYEDLGVSFAFDPSIAYGANAADCHHEPDNTELKPGDCIILDIGCNKDSYCSDMTRTVFYKQASEKARTVYNVVLEANKRAIATVKPGVRFCDIDAAARSHIEAAGFGKGFLHRTGHAIGLEVHDFGDVSSVNTEQVQPGMIFSVEPCVVIPGELGIRVEDLVLVTETGCEVLNKYNKDLMIIE